MPLPSASAMSPNHSDAVKGTIHAFFPSTKPVTGPGIRRALDAPTPPPPKKGHGITRVNPPSTLPGASNVSYLRRSRPRLVARMPPKRVPRPVVVAAPGVRQERDEALTVEDLWHQSEGPPLVRAVHDDDNCNICMQLLSHPVL
ncbi:hypothetical protein C8R43DRAFT_1125646 [Mycena crocata]|nr:hypothetical protein C8R43DRAFT_1125646 [Mycena crocata]